MGHDEAAACVWIVSSQRFSGIFPAGTLRCVHFLDDGTRGTDDGTEDLDGFVAYCAQSTALRLE